MGANIEVSAKRTEHGQIAPNTDPRLTALVYTDERLLPLAAELQNVPAIPLKEEGGAIGLLATWTDG